MTVDCIFGGKAYGLGQAPGFHVIEDFENIEVYGQKLDVS